MFLLELQDLWYPR